MKPMDDRLPISRQLAVEAAPVVLINLFTLEPADEAAARLHRALGDSPAYLNHAVWESTQAFRAAFTHPDFIAGLSAYPASAIAAPHLFQKVAVPGICVA